MRWLLIATTWFTLLSPGLAAVPAASLSPKIAWYGTLQAGLTEAKRSGRPILLISAAPQCQAVPGMW